MTRLQELESQAKRYSSLHNENGQGYNPYNSQIDEELERLVVDSFGAEWTKEVTAERRAIWNQLVTSSQIKGFKALTAAESTAGFKMADLKKAIALHS